MIADQERRVDVDVRLSPVDALDASRWMFFAGSRYAMISFLFLFGIFPVGYFLFTLREGQPSWILLAYPAAMLLVVPGIYWGTKQNLAKSNSPGQAVRYSFSRSGVEISSPTHSSRYDWSIVVSVAEGMSAYMLSIKGNQLQLIPFRCFSGPDHLAAFRELIAEQGKDSVAPRGWRRVLRIWFFLGFLILWIVFLTKILTPL
jgi:hypothetical protein